MEVEKNRKLESTRSAIDPYELCSSMTEQHIDAPFTASTGATHLGMQPDLFDDVTVETVDSSDDDDITSESSDDD